MVKLEQLTSGGAPQKNETFGDPIRHLRACHERIEDRLQILERVAERYEEKPAEASEALRSCFRFFDTNGAWHTQDEELSVFPRLRPALSREEESGLQKVEAEHQSAGRLYAELKLAASNLEPRHLTAFRQRVHEFCAHYRAHIQFEEPLLDSVAAKLTPVDLAEIAAEMKRRRI